MGNGAIAVSTGFAWQDGQALELAAFLAAPKAGYHLIHQVVNIQEFQLYAGVVHGVRQVVGKGVAEGGHGTVVIGAAPLAKEVGKAVHQDPRAGVFSVL